MISRMEEFRAFVNRHPLLKEEVRSGKGTWQNIYEEWVLYGDENAVWKKFEEAEPAPKKASNSTSSLNLDSIKSIYNYVQKLNPDSVNKTLNTVQRVIQIVQTVGGNKASSVAPLASSMYTDWWD